MNNFKSREEILKSKYGFNPTDYKYICKGAEILESIDQDVVIVSYNKVNGSWETKFSAGHIKSIDDFEPMTMTYMCKYTDEEGEKEIRIQPEGFSYENSEVTEKATRFVPLHYHYKLASDELFFRRVAKLFEERDTLASESLTNISNSKEKSAILKYSRNVCMVVKMNDGTILCSRVIDIRYKHKQGTTYAISITNEDRTWNTLVDMNDKDYDFENGIGRMKLIDLIG